MLDLAIVGSGPTALYALKRMIAGGRAMHIVVFEASDQPGAGMPYARDLNSDQMLCNAFSLEIPPVTRPFVQWLRNQNDATLARWGLTRSDIGARRFYPRTLLGDYFADELHSLCNDAAAKGHTLEVRGGHRILDVAPFESGVTLTGRSADSAFSVQAAHVLLATGHRWNATPEINGVPLMSPWPASRLEQLASGRIAILGSSLSAIDAALTIAASHGRFEAFPKGVRWLAEGDGETLRITLLSTNGAMPEPDFHYTYPYAPLKTLSEAAVADEVSRGPEGLLDRVFALLLRELADEAPDWLGQLDAKTATPESFAKAYFSLRQGLSGLKSLRIAFAETRDAMARKETSAHRYVLLRADAALDGMLRCLTEADFERFQRHLLPVIADAYAAVPHPSVARILALEDAGVLDLWAVGEAATYERTSDGTYRIAFDGETLNADMFIDARGQRAEPLSALPFPSLVAVLAQNGPVVEPFSLALRAPARADAVYCLSMPQVLERHPFSQGLAECANLAARAADDLLARHLGRSVDCAGSVSHRGAIHLPDSERPSPVPLPDVTEIPVQTRL